MDNNGGDDGGDDGDDDDDDDDDDDVDDDDVDKDPTEDDTEMIRLAEEARAKVDAVVKKFKVNIRNRFKEKQIEQANK